MRLLKLVGVVGIASMLGIVAACVGDGPSGTPGTEGQPCNNGACNAGLTCLSDVCVSLDAGGGDGGSPESSPPPADAGSEAMPPPCPFMSDGGAGIACGSSSCTPTGQVCCEGATGNSCTSASGCSGPEVVSWQCDDPHQCGAQQHCCAAMPPPNNAAACPKTTSAGPNGASVTCAATCTKAMEVCTQDSDCSDPQRHCQQVDVTAGTTTKLVGLCL